MSQSIDTRTPTGSPKKSPFKPIYPRNTSPKALRQDLIRQSPLKFSTRCTIINKETRRKSMFSSNVKNDPVSLLSRSNSLQNMTVINMNTNRSQSSSSVCSNSDSPLKNLVNDLNEYERSSPLRRSTSSYFSLGKQFNGNNDGNFSFDNIPFSFYEESQSDREAVVEQYLSKSTITENQIGQENVSPDASPTKIIRKKPQSRYIDRTVFKELTSKEYGGSITDPKTEKTICLHPKITY